MHIDAIIRQPGPPLHCFVEDVWRRGACIKPDRVADVPEHFELWIDGDIRRTCQTVWRSSDRLGIAFLDTVH
jgi:hypothetical protein